MKKEENQLFKQLCSFESDEFDGDLLPYASPEVLGYLFFNRMQGTAYGVLEKHGNLGAVNREFRNSLKGGYEQNIEKNKAFFRCMDLLSEVLKEYSDKYAMLKGALLCRLYPKGYRTSNDIDLLVRPQDVTVIGSALNKAGFRQGNIRSGKFVPADRKEIIESKMLRGETVPYILEIGLEHMRYLEVDINFSPDYKNGNTDILDRMLSSTVINDGIVTLNSSDFFIHLCSHLYKEATTLPWVKMQRDMTLYKYADIYMLLNNMDEKEIPKLFNRAKELDFEKICAFAILQTAELFDLKSSDAMKKAKDVLTEDTDFLHSVVSPSEKKTYLYRTKDIVKRFFLTDRMLDLEEVNAV